MDLTFQWSECDTIELLWVQFRNLFSFAFFFPRICQHHTTNLSSCSLPLLWPVSSSWLHKPRCCLVPSIVSHSDYGGHSKPLHTFGETFVVITYPAIGYSRMEIWLPPPQPVRWSMTETTPLCALHSGESQGLEIDCAIHGVNHFPFSKKFKEKFKK